MTERKWTAGPWVKRGQTNTVQGPEGNTVADVRYKNGKNDAHLIAAAPDLYEALEEIRDMLWSRPDISDRLRPLMGFAEEATNQKARAALVKARGESE